MFSNSINSSLIGFARPNWVGEEEASWLTATSVGDVGGGRGGGREVDRGGHVRLLLHGVDGSSIRQAPICVPADTDPRGPRSVPFHWGSTSRDSRIFSMYLDTEPPWPTRTSMLCQTFLRSIDRRAGLIWNRFDSRERTPRMGTARSCDR